MISRFAMKMALKLGTIVQKEYIPASPEESLCSVCSTLNMGRLMEPAPPIEPRWAARLRRWNGYLSGQHLTQGNASCRNGEQP